MKFQKFLRENTEGKHDIEHGIDFLDMILCPHMIKDKLDNLDLL